MATKHEAEGSNRSSKKKTERARAKSSAQEKDIRGREAEAKRGARGSAQRKSAVKEQKKEKEAVIQCAMAQPPYGVCVKRERAGKKEQRGEQQRR